MKKVQIGNSPIILSQLAFGTSSLHRIFKKSERIQLLTSAIEQGISHFDTSPYYGGGIAEEALGNLYSMKIGSITVTTKFGIYSNVSDSNSFFYINKLINKILRKPDHYYDYSAKKAEESLQSSLRRLKVDIIDFFVIHEPFPSDEQIKRLLEFSQIWKSKGYIKNFGFAGDISLNKSFISQLNGFDSIQLKDIIGQSVKNNLSLNMPIFTYGYFKDNPELGLKDRIKIIKNQNEDGCTIFSSSSLNHIKEVAQFF